MTLDPRMMATLAAMVAFVLGALVTSVLARRRRREALKQAQAEALSQAESLREALAHQAETLEARDAMLAERETALVEKGEALSQAELARARLETELSSLRERLTAREQEVERLTDALTESRERAQALGEEKATLTESLARLREHQTALSDGFHERLVEREERLERAESQRVRLEQALEESQEKVADLRENLRSASTQRDEKQAALVNYQAWWEREKAARETLAEELANLKTTHGELTSTLSQKQQHFDEQLTLIKESRDQLKQEFENLANEILERKGKAFSDMSQQRLTGLLQPIQSEMKGFREKVESIHQQESEQRVQLRTELKHLQSLNQAITDQADKLTNALQGQKKIQGNWGELMLENVLDGAGLRRGKDYDREVSFTTEDGRRRPDAIVYLPQQKHLVIDAKTSLAAYTRYVNGDSDGERYQALAEHCKAVGDRINELSDRHYYDLPGLNSPEVVVMFIPVESAYVEALKHDESLYQRAIENNVLVATPTTLLTSLNIVRQLWRFEDQSRHSAELASRAEKFYDKLRVFLNSMEDVGKKLDGARLSFDKAMNQLSAGKGNLIKQTNEFRELGVAVKKELPREITERARLELEPGGMDSGEVDKGKINDDTVDGGEEAEAPAKIEQGEDSHGAAPNTSDQAAPGQENSGQESLAQESTHHEDSGDASSRPTLAWDSAERP